jgi:hypothetical protein
MIALALVVLSTSDASAKNGNYADRGVYLVLAGTAAFPLFSDAVPASNGPASDPNSSLDPQPLALPSSALGPGLDYGTAVGFNLGAGLRVRRHVGLDLALEFIPSFEARSFSPADIDTTLITINGRWYLPGLGLGLSDRIQPYALTGAGILIADTRITPLQSDFAARLGGGIDYWLTSALALGLNATYVLTTGDVDGLDYVSLSWGLQYTFH